MVDLNYYHVDEPMREDLDVIVAGIRAGRAVEYGAIAGPGSPHVRQRSRNERTRLLGHRPRRVG